MNAKTAKTAKPPFFAFFAAFAFFVPNTILVSSGSKNATKV
jgi:hypothetical protein